MKIALVGYGKMGHAVERAVLAAGHSIVARIDRLDAGALPTALTPNEVDMAIEFTHPDAVVNNLSLLIPLGIPLVVGTTGWLGHTAAIAELAARHNTPLIYGANFSIGVNILFALNKSLAKLMTKHPAYDCYIEEAHHRHKADAPSGTALHLAQDTVTELGRKQKWVTTAELAQRPPTPEELSIASTRAGELPGTHRVVYTSASDELSLEHRALTREGFAAGALFAAEWLLANRGIHEFSTLFNV